MAIDQLDLRLLRYFVAVAEELHFGRAAARLHIAQPSLSNQIRRLETQLGVELLRRSSRRVELTPAGETLLRDGKRLLGQARRLTEATRTAGAEALTVGFFGSAGDGLLATVVAALRAAHPAAVITIRELLLGELGQVADGSVDIALARLAPEQAGDLGIEIEVLAQEPRVAVLPAQHRLAGHSALVFADLSDERFIVNPAVRGARAARWESEQRRHGLSATVAAEVASLQELLTCVGSGQGISLVAASVAQHHPRADLAYVPVLDAEPTLLSLARPNTRRRPIDDAFIALTRAAVAAAGLQPPPN